MPTFNLPGLTLTDGSFAKIVTLQMPEALALLIMRLGATVFQPVAPNQLKVTKQGQQICLIVETKPTTNPAEIPEAAATLVNAIKEAYAACVALQNGHPSRTSLAPP